MSQLVDMLKPEARLATDLRAAIIGSDRARCLRDQVRRQPRSWSRAVGS